MSIDDYRSVFVQNAGRFGVQFTEWNVDGSRQVSLFEFSRRQHFHKLAGVVLDEALDFVSVDWCRHGCLILSHVGLCLFYRHNAWTASVQALIVSSAAPAAIGVVVTS